MEQQVTRGWRGSPAPGSGSCASCRLRGRWRTSVPHHGDRHPLLEVKGNKARSRLPLPGSRLKRGPDQMDNALEPEKKRIRGLGTVTKIATSHPRAPPLTSVPQTQGQTTAQKVPKKTGPWCSTAITTVSKSKKPVAAVPAQKPDSR
ncbi:kinesin-like protein KIFC1 [Trichechus inunguis]